MMACDVSPVAMFFIRVDLHKTIYDTFEPGHRDPASPTTLAATAAELQGSARIVTELSTASYLIVSSYLS